MRAEGEAAAASASGDGKKLFNALLDAWIIICLLPQVSPEELVKQAEEKERETDGVMKQTKVLGLPYIQTTYFFFKFYLPC